MNVITEGITMSEKLDWKRLTPDVWVAADNLGNTYTISVDRAASDINGSLEFNTRGTVLGGWNSIRLGDGVSWETANRLCNELFQENRKRINALPEDRQKALTCLGLASSQDTMPHRLGHNNFNRELSVWNPDFVEALKGAGHIIVDSKNTIQLTLKGWDTRNYHDPPRKVV